MGISELSQGVRRALIVGGIVVLSLFGNGHWFWGLLAGGALAAITTHLLNRGRAASQPWPWPADFRASAEALARPVDPTPSRVLPRDPDAFPPETKDVRIAEVATTKDELAQLIADKPHAWPWALFTSVLVQRRNAVTARLRGVVSGYQPRAGLAPLSGQIYAQRVAEAMRAVVDQVKQLEQFMLSPAFKGAFGTYGENDDNADADAITAVANRLMDYHESLLRQAETCLQTPVQSDALVFVGDAGAFALCPLIGYDEFIKTMCARIGEAQDLLPFTKGGTVVALDDAQLGMDIPDGLDDRVVAHIKRFSNP